MSEDLPVLIARLGSAVLLGILVGLDREIRHKALGLRTHVIVALGSAAFAIASIEIATRLPPDLQVSFDPSRVIQGIIGGIGFLGAGAIIRGTRELHGVTTGAGIWVMGAIGMSCGFGLFLLAAVTTLFVLLAFSALGWLSHWLRRIGPDAGTGPPD